MPNIAVEYHEAGWHPLELPPGAKAPVSTGRTGYGGVNMTLAEIAAARWAGNIALRMPTDVIGIDVDAYKGGDRTLRELVALLGPLPKTWISFNGRLDGSGIRFFRVPPNMVWITALDGIEIIQWNHRYAVVFPSLHPEGRPYQWVDQTEGVVSDELPLVEDLPELPWAWIAHLSRAHADEIGERSQAVDHEGVAAFIERHDQADAPGYITTIVDHFIEKTCAGRSRHDTMQHCLTWALEHVAAGVAAAQPTLRLLANVWTIALEGEPRRAELWSERRTTEFEAMVRHAIGKAEAKTDDELFRLHLDAAGPTINAPATVLEVGEEEDDGLPRPIDWAEFVRRNDEDEQWLVPGFWPWGRSMALWASAKVGKSELALWCAVRLALGEDPWSGAAITPVDIAYLDYEMTPNDLDDRLSAFDIDPERLQHLHYFQLPALHALDTDTGGREVEALAKRYGVKAVIVDTFSRAVAGEENDADTVRAFYQFTGSRLKRAGIGCLRLDHSGKDRTKGQRGTSAKRDDVDVIWQMKRKDDGSLVLDCTGSSRLAWVTPVLAVTRTETSGEPLVYRAVVQPWPDGTHAKAKHLDQFNVPLGASRREAEAILRTAGEVPGRLTVLCAALKYRRQPRGTSPISSIPLTDLENGGTR